MSFDPNVRAEVVIMVIDVQRVRGGRNVWNRRLQVGHWLSVCLRVGLS